MESSPSHSNSRPLLWALSLHRLLFMGALAGIRTQMTDKKQSAFELNGNGLFMIIAIVELFVVEVTSGIFFCTKLPSMTTRNILKFIDIFFAYIAVFLLLMVSHDHSPKLNWVLDMLLAFGGTCVVCVVDDDDDHGKSLSKSSFVFVFTYLGLFLVPLVLAMVLFVPTNINWIVYSVISLSLLMEATNFLIIFFFFDKLVINEDKQNLEGIQQDKSNNDLEAQQQIHQDKNNNHP